MPENILEVKNLKKVYHQRKKSDIIAVNGISFSVPRGKIFGLLGPNGAGKTTTVKMICGLIKPDQGKIKVNDWDVFQHRKTALRQISAVLEGNRNIYWRLTVRENLEFFAALKDRRQESLQKEIAELLDFFDLQDKADEPARSLSRGMKQKLAVCVCLIADTPLMLLDEPTLGLDVKTSYDIRGKLQDIAYKHNKTVIITTHDMNVVEDICEQVLVMDGGEIIACDKTENLLDLFQVSSYRINIQEELQPKQVEILNRIPKIELKQIQLEDKVSLELELKQPEKLYNVFNVLQEQQTIINSIEQKQINFEKVFMKLLAEKGGEIS